MGTTTNLTNLIIVTALSSSSTSYGQEINVPMPTETLNYSTNNESPIWDDNTKVLDSLLTNTNFLPFIDKTEQLISFAKELIDNSIELEGDYSKIVSENFWDLL